jgi:hypothetical protein
MPSIIGNGHGGPSGRGATPGSELEQLLEEGQERLKQLYSPVCISSCHWA